MKAKDFTSIDKMKLYKSFMNQEIETEYQVLYKLFVEFIQSMGETTNEKYVCQTLVELQQLNVSEEVLNYIQTICSDNKIYDVLNAIDTEVFEVITKKDNIYNMGIPIYEDEERVVMNLIDFFLNILKAPEKMTTYDVDFILIGFIQETQYKSTELFLKPILKTIAFYPNQNINTPFSESIVYSIYSGEHLEIIKDGIKSLHSIDI